MSIKSGKKIGLIASLAMLIGSVVGIGIFFKSHGILRANDWNGVGTLMAWLIGGLLSLSAAVSFSEIGSLKTKTVHGLPGWAEEIGGKKLGYFTRFNYSFFYTGMLSAILGVFGSEMLFMMITSFMENYSMADVPIYAHVILGVAITLFFLTMNFLSAKVGGVVQTVTTVLKWIPLLAVAILGLALVNTNHAPAGLRGASAFTNGQSFSFTAMLSALPAVLFAYDAFLGVASMRAKMNKPEKLPMVVIAGMVSVIVLYTFIALSAILHGSGMVSGLPFGKKPAVGLGIFDQIFNANLATTAGKIVVVFLVVSTLGVINGISAFTVSTHEQAITTGTIFGTKKLRNKLGDVKTTFIYMVIVALIWSAIVGIPAIIINSDSIIDGVSNFPTLFFFAIYAIIILLYTLKRKDIKTKKMNNIVYYIFAWIAIIGIIFVVGYQLIYAFYIGALIDGTQDSHWGLFAQNNYIFKMWQASIVMFAFLLIFFLMPLINIMLIRHSEKMGIIIKKKLEKPKTCIKTNTLKTTKFIKTKIFRMTK